MTYQRAVVPIVILVVGTSLLLFGYGSSDQQSRFDGLATIAPRSIPIDAAVSSFTISPDNRTLAALMRIPDERQLLRIYDLATCKLLSEKEASLFPQSMEFSPDGQKLALMYSVRDLRSPQFSVELWDLNAERQLTGARDLGPEKGHHGTILFQLNFSPDGKYLAAGTRDEVIYLWDTSTGERKLRFQGGVTAGFSADGKTLYGVSRDGYIRQFEVMTGRHLGPDLPARRLDYLFVSHAVFGPTGEFVALGDGHAILIKEARTNRTVCRVDLPEDVAPLGFTADSRTLAANSDHGTYFIDTNTGRARAWVQRNQNYRHFAGIDKFIPWVAEKSIELRSTAGILARGQRSPQPAKSDPPGVALQAELIAVQDTYTLDLEGNSREDYVTRINYGEQPDTPRIDLLLTLRNAGREKVTLKYPAKQPWLHLAGCGALNPWEWVQTAVGIAGEDSGPVTLAPGQTHTLRLTSLDDTGSYPYWVLPGEYTISGYLHTSIFPAPKGMVDPSEDGSGWVTIRCAPTKVQVIEVAGPLPPAPGDMSPIFRPAAPGTPFVPPALAESEACRWRLQSPVILEQGFAAGTPLKSIVEFFADRWGLDIRFDLAAFKAVGKEKSVEAKVGLPPLTETSRSVVLNLLLDRIDAGLDIRKDTIWIVPLAQPKGLVERLELADWSYRRHQMNKSISMGNHISKGAALAKALEIVGEQSGLTVLLDVRAFERAGVKDIAQQSVQLDDAGELPVNIVLDKLLRQVHATFSVRERAVIVFPRK